MRLRLIVLFSIFCVTGILRAVDPVDGAAFGFFAGVGAVSTAVYLNSDEANYDIARDVLVVPANLVLDASMAVGVIAGASIVGGAIAGASSGSGIRVGVGMGVNQATGFFGSCVVALAVMHVIRDYCSNRTDARNGNTNFTR